LLRKTGRWPTPYALKAFGIDANYVKRKAREINDQLNPKVLKVRI
jgi:hypothetical protein